MVITGGELGTEAEGVVRRAVSLARRRGHAQVTPLHVASVMLSEAGGGGVLRAACVRSSRSDPLQCDALELCLSVAIEGRPRRSVLTHHGGGGGDHVPAPSNALAAAIKRAQARQRRGSVASGPGQRLAVKVELEQLVISILDDPSVDRVMREVGLSSSHVRANVEDAVSSDRTGSDRSIPYPVCNNSTRSAQPSHENVQVVVDGGGDGDESVSSVRLRSEVGLPTCMAPPLPRYNRRRISTPRHQPSSSTRYVPPAEVHGARRGEPQDHVCLTPRRKDIVPGISTAMVRCQAGTTKRSSTSSETSTPAMWLLFRGREAGKVDMVKELARLVFGSCAEFIMVSSDSARSGSNQLAVKRRRSWGDGYGFVGARLLDAILENPHRVIMINSVSRLDHESEIRVRNAVADGTMRGYNGDADETMRGYNGDVVNLEDAIVVLTSQLFTSSPLVKSHRRFSLDLNTRAEECEEEKDDSRDEDMVFQDAMDGVFLFG